MGRSPAPWSGCRPPSRGPGHHHTCTHLGAHLAAAGPGLITPLPPAANLRPLPHPAYPTPTQPQAYHLPPPPIYTPPPPPLTQNSPASPPRLQPSSPTPSPLLPPPSLLPPPLSDRPTHTFHACVCAHNGARLVAMATALNTATFINNLRSMNNNRVLGRAGLESPSVGPGGKGAGLDR